MIEGRGQNVKGTYDSPSGWYVTIPAHYGMRGNPSRAQNPSLKSPPEKGERGYFMGDMVEFTGQTLTEGSAKGFHVAKWIEGHRKEFAKRPSSILTSIRSTFDPNPR